MRIRTLIIVVSLVLFSGPGRAQSVAVVVPPPPTIQFATPPALVEVSPGVQVVPESEEEIYFVDGAYWVHQGTHWYRARDHRGAWVMAADEAVPQTLVVIPKGKYKHYKPGKQVVVVASDGEVVKYKLKKVKYKKEK